MMTNKKIGILTWHYYSNFGSALQAFALQYSIHALGGVMFRSSIGITPSSEKSVA